MDFEDIVRPSRAPSVVCGTIHRETIDDVAAPVRAYFDLDVQQMQPGEFRGKMEFIAAGKTAAYREDYPQGTLILGELLGGRFGVAIPMSGSSRFAGKDMSHQVVGSAMTGESIDFLAPRGYSQMVIVTDHARLVETADACRVTPSALKSLSAGRQGMPIMSSPFAVNCILGTFGKLLDSAVAGGLDARQDNFEDLVMEAILSMVDQIDEPYGRPPASVLFRRAVEYADRFPYCIPISSIAAGLRVSQRTLQKAFVSATGLPPHSYLLKRRLHRARRALVDADPGEAMVTRIAMELGFTELGRFSVRYRQLFGEKPVETLRRPHRTIVAMPG